MRAGLMAVMAGLVTVLAVVAGCSDKEGGNALPATTTADSPNNDTTTQPPPRTSSSNGGAGPKIESPLDASKFVNQPCDALSAAALRSFNVSRPGQPEIESGRSAGCIWFSDDQPVKKSYDMGFLVGNKNGLSDTIRGGKKAFPGYFEQAEVDSYPAVFNDLTDDRANGSCNITVGISDTLAFRAAVQGGKDTGSKSCDVAKQVASAVIKTLKGA